MGDCSPAACTSAKAGADGLGIADSESLGDDVQKPFRFRVLVWQLSSQCFTSWTFMMDTKWKERIFTQLNKCSYVK